MKCQDPSLYGNYRTRKFTDIYTSADSFVKDYKSVGIPVTITETNATTLYYLLYARHGNDHILSSDENQFRYQIFSCIFSYGSAWEKKLEIQEKLKGLSEDELLTDDKVINNHAYNPSTTPSTATTEEFETTNEQVVRKGKRSKMGAYRELFELIKSDYTNDFLNKFDKFFMRFAEPTKALWYITDTEGGN